MGDKIIKSPQVRFEGFTDDWEQRKFEEIFILSQGLQIPISKRFTDPGDKRYFYITNEFLREKCEVEYYIQSPAANVICDKEDILMTRTGNTGIVVTDVEGCFHNNFFKIQYDKTHFSKKYICYLLSSADMQKTILNSAGSSTIPDLSHKSFYKISGWFPRVEEQIKIGEYLSTLDNLIILNQRKLELLKVTKKSMLQKMFPKDGQNIPEIRFSGFTGDWKQPKLKDVAYYIRGSFPQPYTNSEFYDEENGKPFVQVADIGFDLRLNPDTKAHISKIAEPKSRFVEAGKVIVALQGSIEKSIGRTAITQYDAYFDRTILIFQDYKIPVDKQYFAQVIKKLFEKEKEKAWGATISTITKEHLNDFIIGLPKIEEQQKIGEYFTRLDGVIRLHQRELDLLKDLKKSMVQQMFI